MKKISLIALLVLVGLLFAAPVRAEEPEQTESQKKVAVLKNFEDDDQLGNFLGSLSPEELAEYVTAAYESGDQELIDRVKNALDAQNIDVASAMNPGMQTPGAAEKQDAGDGSVSDKATAIANALMTNFVDAKSMLDGDDFNTSNPVGNTATLSMPEAE